jgi:phage gp16-like protein
MEKEIAAMEAQEHILMLKKRQMATEIIVKQGIIELQADELLKIRTEFAQQANKVKVSEEKIRKVLDSLTPKVLF